MIIPLTTAPNPILFKKAVAVKKIDKSIVNLILDMIDTFKVQDHPKAVGLAANQIGRQEKIFLALIDKNIVPFINPEILEFSKELQKPTKKDDIPLEGCLSIPGYFGEVKRPQWVKIKFQTFSLSPRYSLSSRSPQIVSRTDTFSAFPAAIICHEMDHLEGHVFTEKLLSQNGRLYRVVYNNEIKKEEFEEVKI